MNSLLWLGLTLVSLGISAGVGLTCLRRRKMGGALAYALVAFSQAEWTLGFILEQASRSLEAKVFWDDAQLLGACGWWLSFLAFSREFARRRLSRSFFLYGILALPCAAFMALVATDPLHGLMREDLRLVGAGPGELLYDFGPTFLAAILLFFAGLGYGLSLIAVRMERSLPAQRPQVALVLAGNILPLLGTVLTVTVFRGSPYRDISPYTFALGNLLVAVGLFRYGLFDVVPIAWERIVEEMDDFVLVVDTERRVLHLNRAAAAIAAESPAAAGGRRYAGRKAEDLFPILGKGWCEASDAETDFEVEAASEDGPRWFEARVRPLRDPDGALLGSVAVIRDITGRKRMEQELAGHQAHLEELVAERTTELSAAYERLAEQVSVSEKAEENLRQAQKMEAVGRLAGGIVHDFNNLLVPILGYAEMARMNAKPGTQLHTELGQIEESARRASDLVAQILAFSRRQVMEFQILDLNGEIRRFAKLLGRFIGDSVRLELQLMPSLNAVKADKSQVQQILMNLCVNARDAMPEGGRIVIRTSNTGGEDCRGEAQGGAEPGVLLSVKDTGCGMDAETQKHIFEPFYTTKQSGKGTGLGLAVVYGIMERHGGRIRVASRPGAGTEFRLYFPGYLPAQAPPPPGAAFPEHGEPFRRGTESILVVDPDEGVRRLAHDALIAHGYRVSQAAGPEEACALAAGAKGALDLLLTDVALPGTSGPDLFPKVKAMQPGIRVLYMSGFAEQLAQVERHGAGVLKKPFAIRNLLEAVQLALGHLAPAAP